MRLIDADAMRQEWVENGENEYVYDTNSILNNIDRQLTIDPEDIRPKGEWLLSEMDFYGNRKPICNICKEYPLYSWNDYKKCKFCPNCGAKMEDSEI